MYFENMSYEDSWVTADTVPGRLTDKVLRQKTKCHRDCCGHFDSSPDLYPTQDKYKRKTGKLPKGQDLEQEKT